MDRTMAICAAPASGARNEYLRFIRIHGELGEPLAAAYAGNERSADALVDRALGGI